MASYYCLSTRYTYAIIASNDEAMSIVRTLVEAGYKKLAFEIVNKTSVMIEASGYLGVRKGPIEALENKELLTKP